MKTQKKIFALFGVILLGFGFVYYYTGLDQFDQSHTVPLSASSTME